MREKLVVTNWFPVQIVVTNELDWDIHGWLKAFSPNLKKDDFRKLLDKKESHNRQSGQGTDRFCSGSKF